jgi:putative transcriptional regulator
MRVTGKHGEPWTRGSTNWKRIDAMTDEEATANARADPDAQPLSEERLAKCVGCPTSRYCGSVLE